MTVKHQDYKYLNVTHPKHAAVREELYQAFIASPISISTFMTIPRTIKGKPRRVALIALLGVASRKTREDFYEAIGFADLQVKYDHRPEHKDHFEAISKEVDKLMFYIAAVVEERIIRDTRYVI